MLGDAIRQTFLGLVEANRVTRAPAPLSALTVGLKCGGSDGFSGITANPAIGHLSDLIAALGGKSILSEFPELCGVEQDLIDRCKSAEAADKFISLMRTYAARAEAVGSGFDMNPSPGNIKDGLITDAMKSAGAARKGGTSPVSDVLDYPQYASESGLNLLCTPGSDVEAVTAQVGAGANVVLFTTGLGTPTGNPITPVVKLATNSELANRMHDIIDIDTGRIISGDTTIEQMGESILEQVISVASGEIHTKAELKSQEDFIPWKRGVSLGIFLRTLRPSRFRAFISSPTHQITHQIVNFLLAQPRSVVRWHQRSGLIFNTPQLRLSEQDGKCRRSPASVTRSCLHSGPVPLAFFPLWLSPPGRVVEDRDSGWDR